MPGQRGVTGKTRHNMQNLTSGTLVTYTSIQDKWVPSNSFSQCFSCCRDIFVLYLGVCQFVVEVSQKMRRTRRGSESSNLWFQSITNSEFGYEFIWSDGWTGGMLCHLWNCLYGTTSMFLATIFCIFYSIGFWKWWKTAEIIDLFLKMDMQGSPSNLGYALNYNQHKGHQETVISKKPLGRQLWISQIKPSMWLEVFGQSRSQMAKSYRICQSSSDSTRCGAWGLPGDFFREVWSPTRASNGHGGELSVLSVVTT